MTIEVTFTADEPVSEDLMFDSPVIGYFHTETEEIEHISRLLADTLHRNMNRFYGDSE